MRYGNYAPEKKDPTQLKLMIIATGAGIVSGLILIAIGLTIKATLLFIIKYWIYLTVGIIALILIRRFFKTRTIVHEYHQQQQIEEFVD